MTEIQELYQQVILDHNKNPRNFGKMDHCTFCSEGYNPLCGDHLNIYVKMDGDKIEDVKFDGSGCAISKASASIMTMMVKGKTKEEADKIFEQFHDLVTTDNEIETEKLGKLAVFYGVREFPTRVKCASLAWHTFNNAIHEKTEPAITE